MYRRWGRLGNWLRARWRLGWRKWIRTSLRVKQTWMCLLGQTHHGLQTRLWEHKRNQTERRSLHLHLLIWSLFLKPSSSIVNRETTLEKTRESEERESEEIDKFGGWSRPEQGCLADELSMGRNRSDGKGDSEPAPMKQVFRFPEQTQAWDSPATNLVAA
jgi:hypothetical protein